MDISHNLRNGKLTVFSYGENGDKTYHSFYDFKKMNADAEYFHCFILTGLSLKKFESILILGNGAGTLAKAIEQNIDTVKTIDGVELNPKMIDKGHEIVGFEKTNCIEGDVLDFHNIEELKGKNYDLIVYDIYDADGNLILFNEEFIEQIKLYLNKGGSFSINIFKFDFSRYFNGKDNSEDNIKKINDFIDLIRICKKILGGEILSFVNQSGDDGTSSVFSFGLENRIKKAEIQEKYNNMKRDGKINKNESFFMETLDDFFDDTNFFRYI